LNSRTCGTDLSFYISKLRILSKESSDKIGQLTSRQDLLFIHINRKFKNMSKEV
jgi:hypothetical protein